MSQETYNKSRVHDLFSSFLGAFAAFCLITSPWNVDTEGPDPFYKGPLIFPIMVLSMMIIASLPACKRLISPPQGCSWRLDGEGYPRKTLVVLGFLIATLVGLNIVGLEASAISFLSISLFFLGHRTPAKLIILPLVMTGLIVLIFKHFLGVFFPTPLIVEWFWE
jgi:hypothetical protein